MMWSNGDSRVFIDYGRYFVPERETQIALIAQLIPPRERRFTVLDLGCGEGLLARAILARWPNASVLGYDLSPAMLEQARRTLAPFSGRFEALQFDLADDSWRDPGMALHAVVSSLAVHHLDDAGKARLFRDVYAMLAPEGVLVIADVVRPATPAAWSAAADAWDAAVRQRAQLLDGNADAFSYFERERWNMYRYFNSEDIDQPARLYDQLRWLEQAGFSDVDVFWMQAGHAVFGGRKAAG
ncbi:MAG TPA: class I SAM-dependent methyltransferase [Herpetosiphonaceae bacterium]|nr:class I SAM-dependent methyltransferase [Herpetosiphonaceae bacterium]